MPLFGHKNKHNESAEHRHSHHDRRNGNTPGAAIASGAATGAGHDAAEYDGSISRSEHGQPAQPGFYQQGPRQPDVEQPGVGQPGYGNATTHPYHQDTTGTGDPNLTPTSHMNNTHHSGGGSRVIGKVEHVVGSLVGSHALKAKGMQKEQEAQAFQAQSTEIAEAERLEQEAMLRRERAVQLGAHPSNKPLGGAKIEQFEQGRDNFAGNSGY